MNRRIESLDWLRGLLAVSIMVYHLVGWGFEELDSSSVLGRLGIYAVSMFFILSGLSMAIVYNNYFGTFKALLNFIIRRIFRIWPLLWLSIIVVVLGRNLDLSQHAVRILLNFTTLFGFLRPSSYINTGAWSIGNEMVYYALTPAILSLYDRNKHFGNIFTIFTIVIGMIFSCVILSPQQDLSNQWNHYINPFNNLFLYCCGIAIFYNRNNLVVDKFTKIGTIIFALSIFLLYPIYGDLIYLVTGTNRIIFCLTSTAIVVIFYKNTFAINKTGNILLTQMGVSTYSIYLLHPIVWEFLNPIVKKTSVYYGSSLSILLTISITAALSSLCYKYYEMPFVHLGKKLAES
jgi:exopolysaccharide production protein ExoZ